MFKRITTIHNLYIKLIAYALNSEYLDICSPDKYTESFISSWHEYFVTYLSIIYQIIVTTRQFEINEITLKNSSMRQCLSDDQSHLYYYMQRSVKFNKHVTSFNFHPKRGWNTEIWHYVTKNWRFRIEWWFLMFLSTISITTNSLYLT